MGCTMDRGAQKVEEFMSLIMFGELLCLAEISSSSSSSSTAAIVQHVMLEVVFSLMK